jgi:hypothetical protein
LKLKNDGAQADAVVLSTTYRPHGKEPAMLMALKSTDVNNHTPHISGRGLRRRKLTRRQRVRLAADLVSGEAQLDPSLNQVCELLAIPPVDVRGELKVTEQTTSALVEAWDAATEPEREAAVRTIGVAQVWDVLARVVS